MAFTAACLAGCEASPAASETSTPSRRPIGQSDSTVRVLQMNLCNSGRAACYSGGRAVNRADALIREHQPDMVSLNEVCRDDLVVLRRAMSDGSPATEVASAFMAATDRPSQAPVRCRNGQDFGDGVLVVVSPRAASSRVHGGVYPVQDADDPEGRVWVCVEVGTRFSGCTTHATSHSRAVALQQCRHLLGTVVPGIARSDGAGPVVLGADLNLPADGAPNPQSCLPSGYQRADDGGLQDVVVGPGVEVRSRSVIDMQGATDHPGLLVDVELPGR